MTVYHLLGALSSVLTLLPLAGFYLQLAKIAQRRGIGAQEATASLSTSQFLSFFVAYFGTLLLAVALPSMDHYLFWSRLLALALVLAILFEIARDRGGAASIAFLLPAVVTGMTVCFLVWDRSLLLPLLPASQALMLAISGFVVFGARRQITLIRTRGETGALSARMLSFTLAKDVAMIGFGLAMGLAAGWPVIALNGTSLLSRGAILCQFRRFPEGVYPLRPVSAGTAEGD